MMLLIHQSGIKVLTVEKWTCILQVYREYIYNMFTSIRSTTKMKTVGDFSLKNLYFDELKFLLSLNDAWYLHSEVKGIGSILFLKNGLKKFCRKNYKNHLRSNNLWGMYSCRTLFSKYFRRYGPWKYKICLKMK